MQDFDCLLVKTAPEITLKSTHVRKYFYDKLVKNLKGAFRQEGITGTRIARSEGRFYIYAEQKNIRKIAVLLGSTFGVFAYAYAQSFTSGSLKDIAGKVTKIAETELKKMGTFSVRAKFPNEKNFSSKDVEIEAGSAILAKMPKLKVNLGSPEKTIFAEGRQGKVWVYSELVEGPAGLPVGCQGNVAVLFDGSKESVISAWLMLKRGCSVFPVADKKTAKSEKQLETLVRWNAGRKFMLTQLSEISGLIEKPDISVKALVKANETFSKKIEGEKSVLAVPIYEPLLFFPKEMKKQIGAVLK